MALNIGKIVVSQPNRTTVTSSNFRPSPNVAFAGLNDVSTIGLQNGFTLIYSAANNKYEMKAAQELTSSITSIDGGTF
jgi:hypothetical protein